MPTNAVTRATVTVLQAPPSNAPSGFATTLKFHGWTGWIPDMQAVIDRYARQGATGSGAQMTGILGDPVRITAFRLEDSSTTSQTNVASWHAFEGLVCSVVDPWGRSLPRVRFTECRLADQPRQGLGPLSENGVPSILLVTYTAMAERLPDSSS